MSKNLLPWSLKGVSLEARARAKAAAGDAGEPLGKWLGDTIRQVAETEVAKTAPGATATTPPPEPPAMGESAPDGQEVPPTGEARATEGQAPGAAPSPQPATDGMDAAASASPAFDDWRTAFADLARRIDESERRLTASVAPLQVAVERVLSRLDREQPRPRRGRRFPGFGRSRDDR